jgi:hypothetical protein
MIPLPLKQKHEFINDSEYIKYCKKRYIQRCNYEYRQRQKNNISIGDLCSLLSN